MACTPRRIVIATVGFFLGLAFLVLGALALSTRGAAALGLFGGGLAVILFSSWVSAPKGRRSSSNGPRARSKDPAP